MLGSHCATLDMHFRSLLYYVRWTEHKLLVKLLVVLDYGWFPRFCSLNCLFIPYIYNNSSLTTSREPLYNLRRIPYDIWLSNRRTPPLFVADEYRGERIYFRHWEHCLLHWASCKYLLLICLLFCLILSCKIYEHMHSYFMTLQIYSIDNNYPTPPSWTYGIIQNCE